MVFLLTFASFMTSCVKEEEPPLPYIKIDFSLPLPNYPNLLGGVPIKYGLHIEGYMRNGIIIFPQGYGDNAEFLAYDATCTRDILEETSSINIDGNNVTATCPRCHTVYNLNTGMAQNADYRLQQYAARRSGSRLFITTY